MQNARGLIKKGQILTHRRSKFYHRDVYQTMQTPT